MAAHIVVAVVFAAVFALSLATYARAADPGQAPDVVAGNGDPDCLAGTMTNTSLPVISGAAVPGLTLTTSNGSWIACGPLDYYEYSWKVAGVEKSTTTTYAVVTADLTKKIDVTVSACSLDWGCTASATSVGVTGYTAPALGPNEGNGPVYLDFYNNDGMWRIFVRCSANYDAGPGYVALMKMGFSNGKPSGNELVNDQNQSEFSYGIGKFVFRSARIMMDPPSPPVQGTNAFDVNNGYCDVRNNFHGQGAGVRSAASSPITDLSSQANYWTASTGVSTLDQVVTFTDHTADLIKVYYRWRISANVVQMWANVVSLCASGTCGVPTGSSDLVWIKGPKFIAGLGALSPTPGVTTGYADSKGFSQWTLYGTNTATGVCANNGNSVGQCNNCATTTETAAFVDCPGGTLDRRTRARAEANYAQSPGTFQYSTAAAPGCGVDRCFEALFRGYAPDSPTYTGTGPGGVTGITSGNAPLDWYSTTGPFGTSGCGSCTPVDWARKMDARPRMDGQMGTGCETLPSEASKWEEGGTKSTDLSGTALWNSGYFGMTVSAFGWRDCVNVIDDQSLYRQFESGTPDYGAYATFSFNGRWNATYTGALGQ